MTEVPTAQPAANAPLGWHAGLWQQIASTVHNGRLGHALLVCGNAGVGKRRFAQRLARALLCQTAQGAQRPAFDACGHCAACRYFDAGTHPGYRRLALDTTDATSSIPVEAVRGACTFLALTTTEGAAKVLVIDRADDLNASGLNAVLKTLEEPSAGAYLILTSQMPAQLPATIRSRCQILRIPPPAQAEVEAYLAQRFPALDEERRRTASRLAAGSPLAAAYLLQAAETLDKQQAWSRQLDELRTGKLDASTFATTIAREDAASFVRFLSVTAWQQARAAIGQGHSTPWLNVMREALGGAAKLDANAHAALVLHSTLIAASAALHRRS